MKIERGLPRNRTPLAGFGDPPDPRSRPRWPGSVFSDNRPQSVRNGRGGEDGLPGRKCSRLESNQHLLRFRQAPSPDRLREQNRGRRDQERPGRPRASSTIWFSKIIPGRRRDWLPRFVCALVDFIIRADLSRSRRPALFAVPCPKTFEPRNEKSRRGRLHLGGCCENL